MNFSNLYPTNETAKLVGISRRQLDYWIASGIYDFDGIFAKNGSGITRLFSDEDINKLKKMKAVKEKWRAERKLTISQKMKEVS